MTTDDAPETWADIKARHAREKVTALTTLRDAGLPQADAARVLEMDPRALNNRISRAGIVWPASQRPGLIRPLR